MALTRFGPAIAYDALTRGFDRGTDLGLKLAEREEQKALNAKRMAMADQQITKDAYGLNDLARTEQERVDNEKVIADARYAAQREGDAGLAAGGGIGPVNERVAPNTFSLFDKMAEQFSAAGKIDKADAAAKLREQAKQNGFGELATNLTTGMAPAEAIQRFNQVGSIQFDPNKFSVDEKGNYVFADLKTGAPRPITATALREFGGLLTDEERKHAWALELKGIDETGKNKRIQDLINSREKIARENASKKPSSPDKAANYTVSSLGKTPLTLAQVTDVYDREYAKTIPDPQNPMFQIPNPSWKPISAWFKENVRDAQGKPLSPDALGAVAAPSSLDQDRQKALDLILGIEQRQGGGDYPPVPGGDVPEVARPGFAPQASGLSAAARPSTGGAKTDAELAIDSAFAATQRPPAAPPSPAPMDAQAQSLQQRQQADQMAERFGVPTRVPPEQRGAAYNQGAQAYSVALKQALTPGAPLPDAATLRAALDFARAAGKTKEAAILQQAMARTQRPGLQQAAQQQPGLR